ncbi:hypothetical protein BRADI_5g08996v3 [Brachypodium distachyon]|uniref:Uncharacterized protein n=1 Tax=Brachypodium distachyon TaxID=15368 RepID=A0A2K2CG52_BRADI|nr:hypothetical protein BRADI_5g08996v3 [Brachypodium distachyon]
MDTKRRGRKRKKMSSKHLHLRLRCTAAEAPAPAWDLGVESARSPWSPPRSANAAAPCFTTRSTDTHCSAAAASLLRRCTLLHRPRPPYSPPRPARDLGSAAAPYSNREDNQGEKGIKRRDPEERQIGRKCDRTDQQAPYDKTNT